MEDRRSAGGEQVATIYPRYNAAVLGFRNYWYPVAFFHDLGKKPQALQVLGEKVLLLRDGNRAFALRDRCPHRGIPLSQGRQLAPGTITCAYHGWTYDLANGELVAALTDGPDSPICGKSTVQVRTYPVEVRAGLVWIYIGEAPPPPVEADIPSSMLRPNAVVEGHIELRTGNWRYAAENGIDGGHAFYLHRDSLWFRFRELPGYARGMRMAPSSDGEWLMRANDGVVRQDVYPRVGTWPPMPFYKMKNRGPARVGCRLPAWVGVFQKGWDSLEAYVPVDENHYLSVLLGATEATGLDALKFRLRYRGLIKWVYHGRFNAQDQWMIDLMQIPPERLYRPDISVTSWRRLCQEQARRDTTAPHPNGTAERPQEEGAFI